VPGVGGFVPHGPTFAKTTLHLGGGKKLVLVGDGAGAEAPYIQALAIDGTPEPRAWIPWERLANGATLTFTMGATPNEAWGAAAGARPPAFSE
jgi:putative alpha-1,2-mannosidase